MLPTHLHARLLSLVLVITIPLLIVMLVISLLDYQRQVEAATENALQIADRVSTEQKQHIEATRPLLLTLAELPAIREQRSRECTSLLETLHEQNPQYTVLGAVDHEGTYFCASLDLPADRNRADRPWFQRAIATQTFALGDYYIGQTSNLPVIVSSYPVIQDSEVRAVLLAGLSLDWLNTQVDTIGQQPGIMVSIIDRQGILLAHTANLALVGQPMPETDVVAAVLDQERGSHSATGRDNQERLYSFTPLTDLVEGAYVIVSVPYATVFGPIQNRLTIILLTLLVSTVVAGTVAWWGGNRFLVEPINALKRTTQRLAGGDLSARTDVRDRRSELGVLATAIDQMATALEQQTSAAEQAAAERTELQQRIIAAQQDSIRELSTPLIPIAEGVVALPLVGAVDTLRAQQVMETLLDGAARYRAHTVILDITGVSIVDTQVANVFVQSAQAVQLLGAEVILTGVQPQIAQTLTQLGVTLNGIHTYSSLEAGITRTFRARN